MKRGKIGTITTGLGLIALGAWLVLIHFMIVSWHSLAYLGPLLIIGFGVEVLLNRFGPNSKARYSGLAIIFIIAVTIGSLSSYGTSSVTRLVFPGVPLQPSYLVPVHGSIPRKQVRHIDVEINTGNVTVEGYNGTSITYDGALRIGAATQSKAVQTLGDHWKIYTAGDTLILKQPAQTLSLGSLGALKHAHLNLEVPQNLMSQIDTHNGDITIQDMQAASEAKTWNGGLTFTNITGMVTGHTINGFCHASHIVGPTLLESTNGQLEVSDISGKLTANTTNGSVHIDSPVKGDWQIQTTNGAVDLILPQTANAIIHARTTIGSIGGGADWQFSDNTHHQASVQVGAGTYDIRVQTTLGSVTLTPNQVS